MAEPDQGLEIEGLQRVLRHSAPQAAARMLRNAILKGKLKPGDRLVEQKLAERMGIGQPTLREALKDLEYQGFVEKIPHKGTYVTSLSRRDYEKILNVRIILEAFAVSLAARNMDRTSECDLASILKEMEAVTTKVDLGKYHEVDVAFHQKIWELADNSFLLKTLQVTAFQLFAFALLDLGVAWKDSRQAALQQHKGIFEGLCSRDPVKARNAFISHTVKYWNMLYRFGLKEDQYNWVAPSDPILINAV
jgi:DNA-binding GntR family transcriptional regulator